MKRRSLLILFAFAMQAQAAENYTARRITVDGFEVIELGDQARKTTVRIVPAIGNNAYEMKVNGTDLFWTPYKTLAEWKAKPTLLGNPFLAPWANRLDGDGFWANGKRYQLNPELKNFGRAQAGKPIHGLVQYTPNWKIVSIEAKPEGATLTSRLEFWRYPDWMAQFPFAHTIDMTYRLSNGQLSVHTTIENLSTDTMPVSVAFHPYFRVGDAPRDEWNVELPATTHYTLNDALVPTGETKPNPYGTKVSLKNTQLDDVFGGLQGTQPQFTVKGRKQEVRVVFGPKYPVAVVYAPKGREFICFEPMTGPTNAFNLAHEGKYSSLQKIPAGGKWTETYSIIPA
ncbi:MAG TPA: aldose 1-epimerase, partial [Bryobacteraceae bacterium]|nr:aldose 1-epimerase [Bryobacteraceae bacterium]